MPQAFSEFPDVNLHRVREIAGGGGNLIEAE
jgi:hypothetical protein